MNKTSSVADNLYQLDKDFVVIIARAQRPIIIEAGIYQANHDFSCYHEFNCFVDHFASILSGLDETSISPTFGN